MEASGKMTLTYFDVYGRAEAARQILTHGKVEFTDVRISGPAFQAFKNSGKCPSGQIPVLEADGICMNQSQAIARFCAMKTGIYNSTDPKACWRDDMVLNTVEDFDATMPKMENGRPTFLVLFGESAMDQPTLDAIKEWRLKLLTKLGEILGEGPFFGGAKPSLADFWTFAGVSSYERNMKGKKVQQHVYD